MRKSPRKQIWAVIPLYRPDLRVLDQMMAAFHQDRVVVVNNSREKIKFPPNVLEIIPRDNTGYAKGANLGIRKSLKNGATWVAVCNQDLVMPASAWLTVDRFLRIQPPGICGPFGGTLDPKRWTTIVSETSNGKKSALEAVNYISGSLFCIHREVVDKVGEFHEPYFMYYEDTDLCVRAQSSGFPLSRIPVAGIRHNNRYAASSDRDKQYYLARNHMFFVMRQAPINVRLHETIRLPKTIWEYYRNRNTSAVRGICDYYLHKFGRFGGQS